MEEQEPIIEKIKLLVKKAGEVKIHEFREELESLVKAGEEEEEELEFLLAW